MTFTEATSVPSRVMVGRTNRTPSMVDIPVSCVGSLYTRKRRAVWSSPLNETSVATYISAQSKLKGNEHFGSPFSSACFAGRYFLTERLVGWWGPRVWLRLWTGLEQGRRLCDRWGSPNYW